LTSQLLGPPFALLLLVGGLALAPVVEARPKLQTPALAVTHPGSTFLALSLTGSGLGTPASGSYVEAQGYLGGVLTVQPVDALGADIVVWTDVHVVAKLPPDMTRPRADGRLPLHRRKPHRAGPVAIMVRARQGC